MHKGFAFLAVLVSATAVGMGTAKADSLVYTKGGQVYTARADGTGAHAVTSTAGWTFPSESDSGLIAALDGSGSISVMGQYGGIRNVVPTEASLDDLYATDFPRISPDGSRIAYGSLYPGSDPTVYWTPSTATSVSHPGQSIGQQDMTAPSWINSTRMMQTHFGETVTDTQDQLYFYNAGGADNTESGWTKDPFTPTFAGGSSWEATGFAGAINRQQSAVVLAMDDAGDHGGTAQNAIIDVFKTTGTPGQLGAGCRLTLLPNGSDAIADPSEISPSFSPDGTKFAYATDAGVWVAHLPTNWSDCGTMSSSLAIPGGAYPYWSGASLAAQDGSGTMTGTPRYVRAGSSGNTLTFVYKATSYGLQNGTVALSLPSGWSAPSTSPSAPGYATANRGHVSVSGRMVAVSGLTLSGGSMVTITYGSKAGGGPGATAPASGAVQTWPGKERSSAVGTLTALASSPSVDVLARDGSGAMKTGITSVSHSSKAHTMRFVYTAAAGGLYGGTARLRVPSGWSLPSTTGTAPGYVTSNRGTASVSGQTISVTGLTMAGGSTVTVTYGSRAAGGPGATAPSSTGTQAWAAAERSSTAGTVTSLAFSPAVAVK